MKKGFFLPLIFWTILPACVFGAEMTLINFTQEGEVSKLELILDKADVKADKFNITEDKQIIIDLENTKASDRAMRAFDTSEFAGSVVFVSAYPKPNKPEDLRIAVQLRDNVRSVLDRIGNSVILKVENRFGVFTQNQVEELQSFEEQINDAESTGKYNIPKSDSVEDILENLTLSGRKKYIGKRISFNVKNVAIQDILKLIADSSGFNIILTDEVKGIPPLTLTLTKIPWDQALDTILGLNKLVAKKNGNILMITTLDRARAEKLREIEARKVTKQEEPLVTKIFPISYAELGSMSKIIGEYLTKDRGAISQDARTNSLIVKDTAEIIEKIRRIVEALDTQTPQVLIESKIIEVTESYAKEIGLQNGLNFGLDPIGQTGTTLAEIGQAGGGGVEGGPGFSFSSAPSPGTGGRALFGVTISQFSRLFDLNFSLQLMESESKGRIVASPKVITQNKKAATISTSDTTSFTVTNLQDGQTTQTFEEVSANLNLTVTPQVTNEGSIVLEVQLSKDQFGTRPSAAAPPNRATRTINTNVLVDNGSTIVIGGVYNYSKSDTHSGIPFLKDIPLVGWLFRTPYAPTVNKNELMIFLTPRIINQKEAGLSERG